MLKKTLYLIIFSLLITFLTNEVKAKNNNILNDSTKSAWIEKTGYSENSNTLSNITYFEYSADESLFYTCSQDSILIIWDTQTGNIIDTINIPHKITSICISPDNSKLAYSYITKPYNEYSFTFDYVVLYDLNEKKELYEINDLKTRFYSELYKNEKKELMFYSDSILIAISNVTTTYNWDDKGKDVNKDAGILFYDIYNKKVLKDKTIIDRNLEISSLVFTPDKKYLFYSGYAVELWWFDGTGITTATENSYLGKVDFLDSIKITGLWEYTDKGKLPDYKYHNIKPEYIQLTRDNKYIAASIDGEVKFWNVETELPELILTFNGQFDFTKDNKLMLITKNTEDSTIITLNKIKYNDKIATIFKYDKAIDMKYIFSDDSLTILAAGSDGIIRKFQLDKDIIDTVSNPDDSSNYYWAARENYFENPFRIDKTTLIKYSADESNFYTFGTNHKLRKWDTKTGKIVETIDFPDNVKSHTISPDDTKFAYTYHTSEKDYYDVLIYDLINLDTLIEIKDLFIEKEEYHNYYERKTVKFLNDSILIIVSNIDDDAYGAGSNRDYALLYFYNINTQNISNYIKKRQHIDEISASFDKKYLALSCYESGSDKVNYAEYKSFENADLFIMNTEDFSYKSIWGYSTSGDENELNIQAKNPKFGNCNYYLASTINSKTRIWNLYDDYYITDALRDYDFTMYDNLWLTVENINDSIYFNMNKTNNNEKVYTLFKSKNNISFINAISKDSLTIISAGSDGIIRKFKLNKEKIALDVKSDFELYSSVIYPNPNSGNGIIKFATKESGNIQIKLYSILGTEKAVLFNNWVPSGNHEIKFNTVNINAGIYICSITINGKPLSINKMLIRR